MKALFTAVALQLIALPAHADEIVLRADPHPVVAVTINGKPARFLVDTTLPDIVVLDPGVAERLGVRPAPLMAARVVLDDASIRARVARPRIRFANGKTSRAFAGLFGARWAEIDGVDGAIGPGVLPYDRVRIVLRDGDGGEVRQFTLRDAEVWSVASSLAGEPADISFNLRRGASVLNRAAATHLSDQGEFEPTGPLQTTPFFLGLATATQPGRSGERVLGFGLDEVLARTPAPLAGPADVDMIVVRPDPGHPPRRYVELGRKALAGCFAFDWSRASSTLTVRCS